MIKTKLGISVGLLGFIIYLTSLFGGFIPTIILTGYVLICEENPWIKRTSVKALLLFIVINFAREALLLLPDILSWIQKLVYLFDGEFNYHVISQIASICTSAIGILQTCLFLTLAIKSLNQGTISLAVTDKIIDKYL